jgi:hypothetical protein
LYGYEARSLVLREEHRLRVFGNRVQKRIFRSKRDEVTGGWRQLYNEELRFSFSLPNTVRTEFIEPRTGTDNPLSPCF